MKVYLDDKRIAPPGWVAAKTAQDAIALLSTGEVSDISLDHDLGLEDEVGNGYRVLLWIEEEVVLKGYAPPVMLVHSANPAARLRMEQAILAIENRTAKQRTPGN